MKKSRPINLDLRTIKFPIPAIASILHRVSGFILFLFIPFLLWILQLSLSSPEGFLALQQHFTSLYGKLFLGAFLAALIYHFIAGIRHLLMDAGIGETLKGGRLGASLTIIFSIILIGFLGIWLW